MRVRVLDLDGSITGQSNFMDEQQPAEHRLRSWGRRIRLGCSFGQYRRFERALARRLDGHERARPALTFCGSGDFHHVSLALLRRLPVPVNLLVIDNHPDWMRALPFLHCGTWMYHAARLAGVRQIYHVGGDVDFDNSFARLAPWPLLRSGKITVFPSRRIFSGSGWAEVPHTPVRPRPQTTVSAARFGRLLESHRTELARRPLYISLDKDVLGVEEAAVNWDSGHLTLDEVDNILKCFIDAAHGRLAGMDVVGDWSPVQTRGLFRRVLHWSEHPRLKVDPADATGINEAANRRLVASVQALHAAAQRPERLRIPIPA